MSAITPIATSSGTFNLLRIRARATAIADQRHVGTEDGAIADELGMSVKMVSRYVRFADKIASARASRDRRERRMTEFENSAGSLKTNAS